MLLSFVVSALFGVARVAAEGGEPSAAAASSAEYEELVVRGLSMYNAGRAGEARRYFALAHALRPSARTQRALGISDLALDNYDAAHEELLSSLNNTVDPLNDEQRAEVKQLIDWMHKNLAVVRLRYTPPHSRAEIDGKPMPAGDLRLVPGSHELRIVAEGFEPHQQTFRVTLTAAPLELQINLSTRTAVIPLPPVVVPRESSSLWLWIGIPSALAVVAGGALFVSGWLTLEDAERLTNVPVSGFERMADRGTRATGWGIGIGAVGLAGVLAAAILKLSDTSEQRPDAVGYELTFSSISLRGGF